tara:strand:- start:341 stop:532 length:192 start_codon:yes stop_codon:yes gene_type:complete
MKKPESFDLYTIKLKGKEVFSDLSESEYLERMQDYAIEFYQTGHPTTDELETIITRSDLNGKD